MKLFGREIEGIPQVILVFAAILLVAAGLCGLQLVFWSRLPSGIGGLFIATGLLELGAMLISAGGIVVFAAIWAGQSILERFARPPKDRVQPQFDTKEAVDEDDPF